MSSTFVIRTADLSGPDAQEVARLIGDYLQATEAEKAAHRVATGMTLPDQFAAEATDPATALEGDTVYVAEFSGQLIGVAVVHHAGRELKRMWVDPVARSIGAGRALLDTAIESVDGPLRLSVWDWRTAAIALFNSRGFRDAEPWDDRVGLVCMIRE